MSIDRIIFIIEIIGTVAFAVTGVITALEKKLDIFGAIVLGMVTAVGGGILRDMILGYLPPSAFRHPVYAITAIVTSVIVFMLAYIFGDRFKAKYDTYSQAINIFDSVGLSVFVIVGVQTAADCGFGENAFLAVFVGTLTGVGGSVLRDIMARRVPKILRKRVYALAAIVGALIYQLLTEYSVCSQTVAMVIGAGSILVIRILATIFHWNLPTAEKFNEE